MVKNTNAAENLYVMKAKFIITVGLKPCILPAWGVLNFFQVGVCGPDFRGVGLWTDHCLWRGGGSCELKIPKFGGLRMTIWAKIKVVEAKISNFFLKRGWLITWQLLEMGPLWITGCTKRGYPGPHIAILPFYVSAPPQPPIAWGMEMRKWFLMIRQNSCQLAASCMI